MIWTVGKVQDIDVGRPGRDSDRLVRQLRAFDGSTTIPDRQPAKSSLLRDFVHGRAKLQH